MDPFRPGLAVFGAVTLFLAGLIRTSLFYWPATRGRWSPEAAVARAAHRRYLTANVLYLVLLAASTVSV